MKTGWAGFRDVADCSGDSVEIERTGCARAGGSHDVRINHGGGDGGMTEKTLDRSDIGAGFEQVRRPASLRHAGASSDRVRNCGTSGCVETQASG